LELFKLNLLEVTICSIGNKTSLEKKVKKYPIVKTAELKKLDIYAYRL